MLYVYDCTFEGFLSALTELFRSESFEDYEIPCSTGIYRETDLPLILPYCLVKCIDRIIDRFGDYISNYFGTEMLDTVYRAYLSDLPGIENSIASYILVARRIHKDPIDMLYMPCIKAVADGAKRSGREGHKYLGLLRFRKIDFNMDDVYSLTRVFESETPSDSAIFRGGGDSVVLESNSIKRKADYKAIKDFYYAEFEPATNCLVLIAEHFIDRFTDRPFIIADRKRNQCLLHLTSKLWTIAEFDIGFSKVSVTNTDFELLWQKYFKAMAIPERINAKLQSANMPKKYWKYLVEKPAN